MKLNFTKMHGCGNDYIYFNCFEQEVMEPESLSIRLSDRHFGIGGDGIVLICPSEVADAKMRMFNADGSEGKMCGNATRCIGKYMYDHGMIDRPEMTLETLSGIKLLQMDGVKLTFEQGALDFIVDKAIEFKLGARGLRSITEAIMVDAMYEIPSMNVTNFEITAQYAQDKFNASNFEAATV